MYLTLFHLVATSSLLKSNIHIFRSELILSSSKGSYDEQDIFGSEFRGKQQPTQVQQATKIEERLYWKGKSYTKKATVSSIYKSTEEFDNLRTTFLVDSVFISIVGLTVAWYFGTYKDAFSYGVGSILGLGYALLLGRYVQSIGKGGDGGASARFAPVILLVLLYAKNKETISFIPEFIGFSSYQLGSLLQIFNSNPYGDENDTKD